MSNFIDIYWLAFETLVNDYFCLNCGWSPTPKMKVMKENFRPLLPYFIFFNITWPPTKFLSCNAKAQQQSNKVFGFIYNNFHLTSLKYSSLLLLFIILVHSLEREWLVRRLEKGFIFISYTHSLASLSKQSTPMWCFGIFHPSTHAVTLAQLSMSIVFCFVFCKSTILFFDWFMFLEIRIFS